jgi:hypothetical protein
VAWAVTVIAPTVTGGPPQRAPRPRNFDAVHNLVAERVAKPAGRISAKRLLPIARAAGYDGSARNFRRLVAEQKTLWCKDNHRGRRPAVWPARQGGFQEPRFRCREHAPPSNCTVDSVFSSWSHPRAVAMHQYWRTQPTSDGIQSRAGHPIGNTRPSTVPD